MGKVATELDQGTSADCVIVSYYMTMVSNQQKTKINFFIFGSSLKFASNL